MKLLLAILLTINTSPILTHPSIPKSTQDTVAIVVLKQPQSDQEIKQLISPYQDAKLRRIFREAIDGFSVQGSPQTIAELASQNQVLNVSPVTNYQVETEESVKIIGGDVVRQFFD